MATGAIAEIRKEIKGFVWTVRQDILFFLIPCGEATHSLIQIGRNLRFQGVASIIGLFLANPGVHGYVNPRVRVEG
jgi:hypothetical protein